MRRAGNNGICAMYRWALSVRLARGRGTARGFEKEWKGGKGGDEEMYCIIIRIHRS